MGQGVDLSLLVVSLDLGETGESVDAAYKRQEGHKMVTKLRSAY